MIAPADRCEAVAIGGSMGALQVLIELTERAPAALSLPIFVCLHLHASDRGRTAAHLALGSGMRLVEASDKEAVVPGTIYFAPAEYHLLVERSRTLALSSDEKVNFSRPSIDVLFESAALAYGSGLVALLLSGANADGARGLATVRRCGGTALVQDPSSAPAPMMPQAALDLRAVDRVLSVAAMSTLLERLHHDRSVSAALRGLGTACGAPAPLGGPTP